MEDPKIKLIINGRMLDRADVGLGVYTERLIRGLSRHAFDAELVCFAPEGCKYPFPDGVQVVHIPKRHLPEILEDVMFDWKVDYISQRDYPSHMIIHPAPTSFISRPKQTGVVLHDCIPVHYPIYLGRKFIRRFIADRCNTMARRCHLVLTVSDYSRQDITRHIGINPDRIKTVHNWLPPEYNSVNAKKCADLTRNKHALPDQYWLYVGGYDIRKNVECLLRAYAMAARKTSCPPLVLAGRIPESGTYACCEVRKTIEDLHFIVGREVVMPGFIASEDMPGLYGGAELLIYPSLYEGFGLPVLEAMGCGCPAICANNTSMPEVVKDVDYRFSAQNPSELIDLLNQAAGKPLPLNPSFSVNEFSESDSISAILTCLH